VVFVIVLVSACGVRPGGACPRTAHSGARRNALEPQLDRLRARAGTRSRPPASGAWIPTMVASGFNRTGRELGTWRIATAVNRDYGSVRL